MPSVSSDFTNRGAIATTILSSSSSSDFTNRGAIATTILSSSSSSSSSSDFTNRGAIATVNLHLPDEHPDEEDHYPVTVIYYIDNYTIDEIVFIDNINLESNILYEREINDDPEVIKCYGYIYGNVYDRDGNGISNMLMSLVEDNVNDDILVTTITNDDGYYEFSLNDNRVNSIYSVMAEDLFHIWNKQVKYYTIPERIENRKNYYLDKNSDGVVVLSYRNGVI